MGRDVANGQPQTVLGLSDSHDAGAAVVRDGQVLAAVSEERLNRRKCWGGIPLESVRLVLSLAGVSAEEVDAVAVGTIAPGPLSSFTTDGRHPGKLNLDTYLAEWIDRVGLARLAFGTVAGVEIFRMVTRWRLSYRRALERSLRDVGIRAPFLYCDHHLCHAASVAYTTGWRNALLVSSDSWGNGYCCRACRLSESGIECLSSIPLFHSLGCYYVYATNLCGFRVSWHCGKTTGLAACGDPARSFPVFERDLRFDVQSGRFVNRGKFLMNEIRRLKQALKGCSREDIAAGAQKHLEQVALAQIQWLLARWPERNLGLAGGLYANVKLNQRIAEAADVDEVVIHPHMGDGGLGVGAALCAWAQARNPAFPYTPPARLPHVFLGPSFSDAECERALNAQPGPYAVTRTADPELEIARRLARRKIVARFAGRMEYGPRALGHRSILFHATDPTVNTWLNRQLVRSEFMPFAPVIRYEDAAEFLLRFSEKTRYTAEFMTITYDASPRCRREAPAAVHVDGTVRPQVVRRETQPGLHRIITEFHRLTGESVLINTSFNMHEEPIVCTAEDAVRCFCSSQLDSMILGSFALDRDPSCLRPAALAVPVPA